MGYKRRVLDELEADLLRAIRMVSELDDRAASAQLSKIEPKLLDALVDLHYAHSEIRKALLKGRYAPHQTSLSEQGDDLPF